MLFSSLLLVINCVIGCSGSNESDPPAQCGPNTCNEAVGGGTCDDTSGQAICMCNEGYTGDNCNECAAGNIPVGDACMPASCTEGVCNESVDGGTCDDESGQAVCTCNDGYVGPNCNQCADGYDSSADGSCVASQETACEPASNPSGEAVAAPVLRITLPASWDENWFAAPAVADLDQDGENEIVAARHSVLYAWSIAGDLLWRAPFSMSSSATEDHGSSRMWASPVIADMDGDGDLEIAVGSDADASHGQNIAVYDFDGTLLPGWPVAFGNSEIRSIAGGDLDGDGFTEIAVNKTNTGPATAVYQLDGTFRPGWPQVDNATCDLPDGFEPCWDFGGYNQNIAIGDMDGDGFPDVVSSYDAIGFGVFDRDGVPFPADDSFADDFITSVEAYHDLALSQQGWGTGDRSEFTYSPPVIADIDGDGDMEIVLAGDHEHSSSTENQGITLWVINHDMTRPAGWETPKDTGLRQDEGDLGQNIVSTRPNPSVGDIDPSPGLEILFPAYDGNLYAYGAHGALLWEYGFGQGPSPYVGASEALIADLNGDGAPEIIFNTVASGAPGEADTPAHLIILNAAGEELHKVKLFGRGSQAPPTISDLEGDGDLEIIISLKDTLGGGDGGVQIWDVDGSAANCLIWPTGRGNNLRQGYLRN